MAINMEAHVRGKKGEVKCLSINQVHSQRLSAVTRESLRARLLSL